MNPKSHNRTVAVLVSTGLIGAGLIASASVASAATLVAPASLTVTDANGYLGDAFVVPKLNGVKWSYTVDGGTAQAVDTSRGNVTVKPYGTATSTPTGPGVIAVKAEASDATVDGIVGLSYTVPGSSPKQAVAAVAPDATTNVGGSVTYTFTLDPTTNVANPMAPTKAMDKTTGLDVVKLPVVKGMFWSAVDSTGAAVTLTGAGSATTAQTMAATFTPATASAQSKVTFKLQPMTGFGVSSLLKTPQALSYTFALKNAPTAMAKDPAAGDVVVTDLPGTGRDTATLTPVANVVYKVGTRVLSTTAGVPVTVPFPTGSTSMTITASPAVGYTWAAATGSTITLTAAATNTPLADTAFVAPVKASVTATNLTVTITADANIQKWTYVDAAGKETQLSVPAGASQWDVTLPAINAKIRAYPANGYTLAGAVSPATYVETPLS